MVADGLTGFHGQTAQRPVDLVDTLTDCELVIVLTLRKEERTVWAPSEKLKAALQDHVQVS